MLELLRFTHQVKGLEGGFCSVMFVQAEEPPS